MYVNILGKSEEHSLNVSNADYNVDMRRAIPGLYAVTGCNSVLSSDKGKLSLQLLQTKVSFYFKKSVFASKIS